jgi:hypothetical protein
MSPNSQNKHTWIEKHPGARDFLPIVTDPGKKKVTTPAQKPLEKPRPPEQGEPLISGGPTPQDIEKHKPGAAYEYADVPKQGVERGKFRYELAIEDCYPVLEPDPELMQDPEMALQEQHDYQRRLAVKKCLRALFTGIPGSSPLLKLIEHSLLQNYPAFRKSPTGHPDRLCELFTDTLLFDTASFLDAEEEMHEDARTLIRELPMDKQDRERLLAQLTPLYTLPASRRIKTQHASQPLFT